MNENMTLSDLNRNVSKLIQERTCWTCQTRTHKVSCTGQCRYVLDEYQGSSACQCNSVPLHHVILYVELCSYYVLCVLIEFSLVSILMTNFILQKLLLMRTKQLNLILQCPKLICARRKINARAIVF